MSQQRLAIALAVLIWLGLAASMLGRADPLLDGRLVEGDDYMRMAQVVDLIDGQDWFDLSQKRMGPISGTLMHWSRLPDIPIAATILAATPLMGRDGAIRLAATLVPLAFLLSAILLCLWAARPLVDRRWTALTALAYPLAGGANFQMVPGRVDHHAWSMLATLILAGAFARAATLPHPPARLGVVSGLATAVAFALGGEALPYLLIGFAIAALLWAWRGSACRWFLIGFGASVLLATAALAVLTQPLSSLTAGFVDSFSGPSLAFAAAGSTLVLILAGLRGPTVLGWRLLTAGSLGSLLLVGVIAAYPALIHGPFLPEVVDWWISRVAEGAPLPQYLADHGLLGVAVLVPVGLALIASGFFIVRGPRRRRPASIIFLLFLLGAFGLTFLWTRTLCFAVLLAIPLVAGGIGIAWARAQRIRHARWATALRCGPLALPLLVAPAADAMTGFSADPAAENSVTQAHDNCNVGQFAKALGDTTPRVITGLGTGPELLFRSHASILAAPYHRDAAGLLALKRFLSAQSDDAALAVVREQRIDLIAYCAHTPDFTLAVAPGQRNWPAHLFDRPPPAWLIPMPGFTEGALRAWRVDRSAVGE